MPSSPRRGRAFFESRTEQWRQVGLGAEVDRAEASRARGNFVLFALMVAGVLVAFAHRSTLFPGLGTQTRIATVVALVVLGWGLARSLGRGIAPMLVRRMDPATAGTAGFLVRLFTIAAMVIVALRIAGLNADTLAVGGAVTAVVLGLAAQQTVGNLFAGVVLLSTRPFRVGERVRLRGGAMAGSVEGIVSSLGLFYTTFVDGADRIMVPNSVLLTLAVIPLREPERVDLLARFDADTTPSRVQELLSDELSVPTRYPPHIRVEEIDRDEVVARIVATPANPADGARLAAEVLRTLRTLAVDEPGTSDGHRVHA
jgi:small-conductance mechanosensitive channel